MTLKFLTTTLPSIFGRFGILKGHEEWEDAKDRTNSFNGSFLETMSTSLSSDGATVTLSLEQSGGGNLTMLFSDGQTSLDCTPAQTIELTPGSDSFPQENWVYIPKSTGVLTKATSGFPTSGEHVKIGYYLVPSATHVQSEGEYIHQEWNDHMSGTDDQGHILHISEHLRRSGAIYFSGIDAAGTDQDTVTSYFDYVSGSEAYFKAGAGVVYQLHRHVKAAVDSRVNEIYVINWNADPYHDINNLADITSDSTGTSFNNRYFNLVFIGIVNKTGTYQPILCNLPDGAYSNISDAQQDVEGYDVLTIPREFALESSTGFLICRMTLRNQSGSISHISTVDLRGQTPTSASDGVGGSQTIFPDNVFVIYDEGDETKRVEFELSGLTTGTTVTLTVSDDGLAGYVKDSEFTQDSGFLVGTGSGTYQEETGNTARTSLGLGTGDSPLFSRLYLIDTSLDADSIGGAYYTSFNRVDVTSGTSSYGVGGNYMSVNMDDSGNSIGQLLGLTYQTNLDNGSLNSSIKGIVGEVNTSSGTTVGTDSYGIMSESSIGGTITDDVFGLYNSIAATSSSLGGDVYGIYSTVNLNNSPTGTVYGFYLNEGNNIDYGIYQNGIAANHLGGDLNVDGDITQDNYFRQVSGTKTLVDETATGMFEVAIASGEMTGGILKVSVYCSDGSDYQVLTQQFGFNAVNQSGTVTGSIPTGSTTGLTNTITSGTLSIAMSITNGSGKITVNMNANTSLTSTAFYVNYVVELNDNNAITPL